MGYFGSSWAPYVPVAARRAEALREMERLRKKGATIEPVKIDGRQIARTFWGKSWCEHLEKFSDFSNRLPRGRTYVRNGSVCHLEIGRGKVLAKVSGSSIYEVRLDIKAIPGGAWEKLKLSCVGQVSSLLELLQGRFSDQVMRTVTDRDKGLFPRPSEISMDCSCPDWANMCKHVAAVMYGVGARLDDRPELLFLLRGVDHNELVAVATSGVVLSRPGKKATKTLKTGELSEVFGIDILPPSPTKRGKTIQINSQARSRGATTNVRHEVTTTTTTAGNAGESVIIKRNSAQAKRGGSGKKTVVPVKAGSKATAKSTRRRGKLSVEGRAKISELARKRWNAIWRLHKSSNI